MIIKKIKITKSNSYELIIDDEKYVLFSDTLLKFGLFKPGEYQLKLQDILDYNEIVDGYIVAIKYLSHHLRTEKEIKNKLIRKKIKQANIAIIIKRLKEEGHLNEDKYIKAFISDQMKLTLNGPKKIILQLTKLGFNNPDKYLDSVSLEEWEKRANKIIAKKLKTAKGSRQMVIKKIKTNLINLGYNEKLLSLVDNISYDEILSYKKDFEKYSKLYSKKHIDNLDYMVKQKLYSLGYKQ